MECKKVGEFRLEAEDIEDIDTFIFTFLRNGYWIRAEYTSCDKMLIAVAEEGA